MEVVSQQIGVLDGSSPCSPGGPRASLCRSFCTISNEPEGRDKAMMLRSGPWSSLQHLWKNPGQTGNSDDWRVWKCLPDGSDQVSGWRYREESGCVWGLIPAATQSCLGGGQPFSILMSHSSSCPCTPLLVVHLCLEHPCFSPYSRIHGGHLTPQLCP